MAQPPTDNILKAWRVHEPSRNPADRAIRFTASLLLCHRSLTFNLQEQFLRESKVEEEEEENSGRQDPFTTNISEKGQEIYYLMVMSSFKSATVNKDGCRSH